jgi:hypothetical protein
MRKKREASTKLAVSLLDHSYRTISSVVTLSVCGGYSMKVTYNLCI